MAMVIQGGVETCKLSKECRNHKIEFSTKAYLTGKAEVRSKVVAHFPDLDLTFLDEKSKAKEDELAIEAKATMDPPVPTV